MAALILEIRRKHSDRVEYVRLDSMPVHIGRAYGNDIILDDPYISPRHATLSTTDDGWLLEDNGSENGIKKGEKSVSLQGPALIQAGELFIMGETQLRIVTPEMEVEPTRIQHSIAWHLHILTHPAMAWLLGAMACMGAGFGNYLNSSTEFELKEFAMISASIMLFLLLWSGAWAFAGRTLKKKPFFHRQLTVFSIYILLSIPMDAFAEYLEYFTGSLIIGELFSYLMAMAPFAVALYLSLWIATEMKKRRRMVVAGLVTVLIALFTFAVDMGSSHLLDPQAEHTTVLKPPFAPSSPVVSVERFLSDSTRLIENIEIEKE